LSALNNTTAKDFIRIYIDLKVLTPNVKRWTEELFQDSAPRLKRLNQLIALRKAFDINGNWEDFEQGRFVDRFPLGAYSQLMTNMKALKNTRSWKSQNFEEFCFRDVKITFRLFLEFVLIEKSLRNQMTEYSMTYSLGQNYGLERTKSYFTQSSSRQIQQMINDLSIIIDPMQKSLSETELIAKYNYVKIDLDAIDLENY
jgi:hypothetical protein